MAFFALIIVSAWLNYPFIMLIMYSALSSIPQEMSEAPLVDGANVWQRLYYVYLPLMSPAIFVAITFRLVFLLRTFDVPWLMTQGGPIRATELLGLYLYRHGFRFWDFGLGSAVGWVILVLTLLLSIVYIRGMYRTAMQ
jgi:multiple sugar transport system permease protein